MTSLKTSIKTITYLSDIGCLEIQGASLVIAKVIERTKQEFAESMKDNKGEEYYLFLDEVRRNLRVIYSAYRTNY